jgi:hypothetical protein
MAVFIAMLKPGDTVMGMNLDHGGHLTHGSPVNFSGLYFNIVPYGVDDEGFIDYDELERKAKEAKPKLIVAGASAYARTIDFKRFREIADEVGAYLMVDMAHIAGLVAAGEHPSPIPYADVVTTTTHKTLRGPRGGLILANKEAAEKFNFNKAIFPGTQGGPLEHVIAAKAVCLGEALKPEFKEYAHQVVLNAKALADGMVVEPEKQLEYLQAIQNKSARMNDLIHLLFEYVKLDSEGFSLDRKETDLSELLRENAALIYADFEDAGMEFEIDIPEEVVSVSVDPIQFSRVITNLLNNAMKHNESGTHIKIGMYRKNGYIYILVADSGRRIPGELAEHLFEPFTKGDVSRKSGSGSGLGLSIAKKIIEMHGFQMDFIQQLDEKKIPQIAGYTKEFVIQIADDSYDSSLTA